jgi:ribose transport system substrate-binding protein
MGLSRSPVFLSAVGKGQGRVWMRERGFLIAALILSISGLACDRQTTVNRSASEGQQGKVPRVGLVMKALTNEFFSTMEKGAQQHHSEHSDQYELVVNGIKNETDVTRQVAIVDEMVASGMDAIVIAPADSKALVTALRRAQEAGVVVVNIDNRLDAEVLASEGIRIPFVGPDNKAGAKKVGTYLADTLNQGDEVVVLEGIRTAANGIARREGFEEAMKEAGIKIVDSQSAQWEMNNANKIAATMITEHPDIRAVLAANDSMAMGALAAIKAAGREDEIKVVGFDNISAIQSAIQDGHVLATADQHGDQLAVFGIEFALTLLDDEDADVADRETPVDLITEESFR